MLCYGASRSLVPSAQSQEIYDRPAAAGAPVTLVMVRNSGHAFASEGVQIQPMLLEIGQSIVAFFQKNLR